MSLLNLQSVLDENWQEILKLLRARVIRLQKFEGIASNRGHSGLELTGANIFGLSSSEEAIRLRIQQEDERIIKQARAKRMFPK